MKKNKNNGFQKIIKSKKTTAILMAVLLTPFLIFGFILVRDKLNSGNPVVGARNENQLEHQITQEQLSQIEEVISEEIFVSEKVTLKSSTLRIYVEVGQDQSKDAIKEIGQRVYDKVIEVLPIDPYFTNTENNKQYDLEVHVYNDVEDLSSDEFVYFEVIRNAGMEETSFTFLTDAKDPEFKQEVLDMMEAKRLADEAKKNEAAGEDAETEGEEGGE